MCLAIPGEVVALGDDRPDLATIDVSGVRRQVNIGLLDGQAVELGDWVLVHVGFAMTKIDENEARSVLALLEDMGAAYEEELAVIRDAVPDSC